MIPELRRQFLARWTPESYAELRRVLNERCRTAVRFRIAETKARWAVRRKAIDETYERLLRELQKSKIDGAEFIRLRQQIKSSDRCATVRRC